MLAMKATRKGRYVRLETRLMCQQQKDETQHNFIFKLRRAKNEEPDAGQGKEENEQNGDLNIFSKNDSTRAKGLMTKSAYK